MEYDQEESLWDLYFSDHDEFLYPLGTFINFMGSDFKFPLNEDVVIAGGYMDPGFVLSAYIKGYFPWFNPKEQVQWWNPAQRTILYPEKFHLSKSLAKKINSGRFSFKINTQFLEVMHHCETAKDRSENGSWITEPFIFTYNKFFEAGIAHSIEVYENGQLVGGLYGELIGDIFCGESMFSLVSDSSKAALWFLCELCKEKGVAFIDCQMPTDHLLSLGCELIPREEYLACLRRNISIPNREKILYFRDTESQSLLDAYDEQDIEIMKQIKKIGDFAIVK